MRGLAEDQDGSRRFESDGISKRPAKHSAPTRKKRRTLTRESSPQLGSLDKAITDVGTAYFSEISTTHNFRDLAGFFCRFPASDEGPLLFFVGQ